MLAEGGFSNQTDLARYLGFSRARVSRAFKRFKKQAG
jgi:uncharacterized membrane protein